MANEYDKPTEYYNTQKMWHPEGKEPTPEERFYSDPNVERGVIPAVKSILNAPRELKELKNDRFGYGIPQIDEATKTARNIGKDHMYVWNRLVENKGPLGLQKDELQWQNRLAQLTESDAFQNFFNAKTIQEKMAVLRDTGIGNEMDMKDEDLAKYLMAHTASGLTEDPNVGVQAKEQVENDKESKRSLGMSKEEFKERYNPPEEFMAKYFKNNRSIGMSRGEFKERYNPPEEFMNKYFPNNNSDPNSVKKY